MMTSTLMKSNAARIGAVLLPLLLSQTGAFAATRGHDETRSHRAPVVQVHQSAPGAALGNPVFATMPHRGMPDMSDMWPYYLDLG
ncbi:MAG: hypothetical protein ABW213_17210 [Tardiphaga sp.]